MKTFEAMKEEFEREHPSKRRQFNKFGINALMIRQDWGYEGLTTDAMIVLGRFLNVNYQYEPEYVQAHSVHMGYYLGNGRWISFSFSWPRL